MLGPILGAVGGIVNAITGSNAAKRQEDLQKDFAQKGIRWKVADAKAAGVHPLYALGANTVSYSPVTAGGPDLSFLGEMGANIDRARMATSDGNFRSAGGAVEALALERAGLENELLRSQIRRINTPAMVGPAMPSGRDINAHDLTVSPRVGDSQAQKVENEYGEFASDAIGASRFVRDANPVLDNYIDEQVRKVLNGEPNPWLTVKRRSIPYRGGGSGW